ncbi:hypothetical protein NA56DRAFT_144005 [Hyaloscypha hepaticicola]|uniref:Uncharacterized protein n=1 Tax=Hyaloscypha hepaticicola TaxID=2082293 RepID=A0A2J6QN51_9HELO|nr:hypothetical protein NA56DRAFT_144005 [Hyaloscypha hepaticicola]
MDGIRCSLSLKVYNISLGFALLIQHLNGTLSLIFPLSTSNAQGFLIIQKNQSFNRFLTDHHLDPPNKYKFGETKSRAIRASVTARQRRDLA